MATNNKMYTARFDKIPSGYVGQLIEWPAVISEGAMLEECRFMLADAAQEMTLAYRENGMTPPGPSDVVDRVLVEV
jgi:predicted RNase H-like HicB family nuclease